MSRIVLAALSAGIHLAVAHSPSAALQDPCSEWTIVSSPDPADSESTVLTEVAVVAPDDVWAVGATHRYVQQWLNRFTYIIHWDGVEWVQVPSPTPSDCSVCANAGLTSIAVVSADDIWAAGNAQLRNGHLTWGNHILILRWNGSEWFVPFGVPDRGDGSGDSIADIEVIAPDDVWFVGGDLPIAAGPTPGLTIHWDGTSFEVIPPVLVNPEVGREGGNPLNALDALAPDDIWAVGGTDPQSANGDYSNIQRWNGSEWVHVPGPTPGFYNELVAVVALAPDDVWAAGEWWEFDGNIRPLLLHWNGSEWTMEDPPGGIQEFYAFAPDDIYASGSDMIYHFDGEMWQIIRDFPELDHPVSLSGMDAAGPCDIWVAGSEWRGPEGWQRETVTIHSAPSGIVTATIVDAAVAFGTHISGGVPEVLESDDARYHGRSRFGFTASAAHMYELRIGAVTAVQNPSLLDLTVEGRLNQPGGTGRFRLRNWDTNAFEDVHSYPIGATEVVEAIEDVAAANRVRASDGRVELSIRQTMVALFSAGFDSFTDWVVIGVE